MKISRTNSPKTAVVAGLVVANAALGLSLLGRHVEANTAEAQVGRPSEYIMIPAELTSLNQDIVYIVDQDNGNTTAVAFQQNNKAMEFIAPVPLSRFFNEANR